MNIIASFLLTNYSYPFWKYSEKPNVVEYSNKWANSVKRLGLDYIIFTDEHQTLQNTKTVLKLNKTNQIDERWRIAFNYLKENNNVEYFFMTDISDVTVLKNPFENIDKDKIYVGDEKTIVDNEWLMTRVRMINNNQCTEAIEKAKQKTLLNCGLFGGHRNTILPVIEEIANKLELYGIKDETVDMVALNEVLYSKYEDKLIHGKPFNTDFWKWDMNNKECVFQHK